MGNMPLSQHTCNLHIGLSGKTPASYPQALSSSFLWFIVNHKMLETGLRTNSAGIPYTLLLRIEAIGFPNFWVSTVYLESSKVIPKRNCLAAYRYTGLARSPPPL